MRSTCLLQATTEIATRRSRRFLARRKARSPADSSSLRFIREQLAKEGFPSEGEPNELIAKGTPGIFLISENTGNSTSPKVRQLLDQFLKDWTDKGLRSPDHIRFLTYTTRYNKSFWVTVDALARHYERAEVDARRSAGGTSYDIKTVNVTRLALRETGSASEIRIDGQTVRVKPESDLILEKASSGWRLGASTAQSGLRKTHGLQGPIDDTFSMRFSWSGRRERRGMLQPISLR